MLSDFFKVTKGSQGSTPGSWPHSSQCTSPAICRGDPTLTLTFDVDLHAFGHGQSFLIVGLTTEDCGLGQA